MTESENSDRLESRRKIKFRRSKRLEKYRANNTTKKSAIILISITLYLLFIDPILFVLSPDEKDAVFFQTSFILGKLGLGYVETYPYLFTGIVLLYAVFMVTTGNINKLKWLWSIVPLSLIWWLFLYLFFF